ncbi:heterokaryon incompatibility protein-domain-containing protein [Penicillium robsamsonii]|uniref:heterokaryon incompatibility protein-domain-containing protein n=1 Tax=Penicillium robsamsonii TaxID=1792511 RepID=UPI0025494684|nr:heterokaryon incompatibility protein-domain-containing protein [Penicillium robsamsonii]KAJ5827532.1 heterokaryon incompatibility protein-domain-containing protein [Penicillium robsamsonii]
MPNPVLCDWCQTTVLDKHLLAMIDHEKKGAARESEDQSLFKTVYDIVSYTANRDALAGFQRFFRKNTELLLQNASRGCIFCMLLINARGGLLADFITVKDPWEWSELRVAADGDENVDRAY